MAFFRKADAKVRLFFEPPKLFEVFLTIIFSIGKVQNLISLPVFQLICVSLSKAGAKLLLYSIYSKCCKLFFHAFFVDNG